MMTIQLRQLYFRAHHGIYDFEREQGNDFFVDVTLQYHVVSEPVTELAQTMNYEQVFALVKQRMEMPTPLLETLVTELVQAMQDHFPDAVRIEVAITKKNPPVPGWVGDAVVTYDWQR